MSSADLQDLRRVVGAVTRLRGETVKQVTVRSDVRHVKVEFDSGLILVISSERAHKSVRGSRWRVEARRGGAKSNRVLSLRRSGARRASAIPRIRISTARERPLPGESRAHVVRRPAIRRFVGRRIVADGGAPLLRRCCGERAGASGAAAVDVRVIGCEGSARVDARWSAVALGPDD